MKEGELLRRTIDLNPIKIKDLIVKSGIPRGSLYNLYKAEKISFSDKEKLKKAGIIINYALKDTISTDDLADNSGSSPTEAIYERLIKALQDQIEMLKEDAAIIKKDTETFRTIVERGVAEGAIKFVKPNSK